ncbi:MAG: hypothetical protein SF182_23245 [Deltaproteobacteria bacterium]|nr:hypothetical protein [Deltaproteobacteria bacterium]
MTAQMLPAVLALAALAALPPVPAAADFEVLTVGKMARFENPGDPQRTSGRVQIGADRALRTLEPPTCPAASEVEVEVYLQSTLRDVVLATLPLDCAKWRAHGGGYRYSDPTGTVRSIRYTRRGLQIDLRGAGLAPIDGPVGFLQVQLTVGTRTLRARFHNFVRNDAQVVATRRPSAAAAAGEAGFWDALLGDASSEADEQATLALLDRAVQRRPDDGRSHFLIGMMHLYRFGQRVVRLQESSPAARAELVAANAAFATAVPLLWDDASGTGDSRVPGFAASALYTQGVVDGDEAMRAAGLAALERAVAVNAFFNIFDFIPVLQALPPGDPAFADAFAFVTTYLNDPDTLACVVTQPEICGNEGFAPRNINGSLTLFGDLYAKGGDVARAQGWYDLVMAIPTTPSWAFYSAIQDRAANTAQRVALYADADVANDPPLIGAGAEACSMCHLR